MIGTVPVGLIVAVVSVVVLFSLEFFAALLNTKLSSWLASIIGGAGGFCYSVWLSDRFDWHFADWPFWLALVPFLGAAIGVMFLGADLGLRLWERKRKNQN